MPPGVKPLAVLFLLGDQYILCSGGYGAHIVLLTLVFSVVFCV